VLKKDILAQIELADNDIFTVTEKELRAALFKNSPYSMSRLGTADSIDTITRKDIIRFYREHSQGSNMVISVCGDVDKDKVSSLIESRLRGIGNKTFPKPGMLKSAQLEGRIDVTSIMDKEQAVVMAGFKTPGVTCKQRYPLQVLSSIFQGSGGRLFENIRQDKGLAYTLGVFGMAGMDEGSFIFYAAVSPDNVDTVTEKIMNEINSVNSGNIIADDITAAKKSLISQYHTGLQTAGEFAQKTALDELYGLGYDNYLSYPETIQSITLNDVISLSNKYLNPALCVVSKTIPKEQGD
jgi:zinc protease